MAIYDGEKIRELKLAAKWATDSDEKRRAIAELAQFGRQAVPAIEEVLGVTAYDEIRAACIEAIKSAGRNSSKKNAKKKAARRGPKKKNKVRKR